LTLLCYTYTQTYITGYRAEDKEGNRDRVKANNVDAITCNFDTCKFYNKLKGSHPALCEYVCV